MTDWRKRTGFTRIPLNIYNHLVCGTNGNNCFRKKNRGTLVNMQRSVMEMRMKPFFLFYRREYGITEEMCGMNKIKNSNSQ